MPPSFDVMTNGKVQNLQRQSGDRYSEGLHLKIEVPLGHHLNVFKTEETQKTSLEMAGIWVLGNDIDRISANK